MIPFDVQDGTQYRFWVPERVRFADLDLMGHVNNKHFCTYLETGRVAYFIARNLAASNAAGGPVTSMAIVRLEVDYLKEIRFPAELRVGIRPIRVGGSAITLACAIFDGEVCVATSQAVVVRFDVVNRRSKPFTDDERRVLEADL
jgi:acyl-CoA thioester hydrolase